MSRNDARPDNASRSDGGALGIPDPEVLTGKLRGKVALVTGGTSGIGLATARKFVLEGAYVFVSGRRQEKLDEALAYIGREHASAVRADVSQVADLENLFATIKAARGRLDVVFANAGAGTLAALGEITEKQFRDTFDTNVKGVVFTVQQSLSLLTEGASIILNASTTSIKGSAAFSIYSASKAAVRNLARSWIVDLQGRNIRVNVISPGVVPTPGYDGLGLNAERMQEFIALQARTIPLGRVGTPDEIANAVSFLASDESSFVNGIELFVDGGMTQI